MAFPAFAAWAAAFGKVYDGDDAVQRQAIYEANVAAMTEHNNDETQTFKMAPNQFSDLTSEEFEALPIRGFMPGKSSGLAHLDTLNYNGEALPPSVDWTTKGAVTAVKDQGQCGSCWTFSTTGALEGQKFVTTGELTPMSEQQFVDCDTETIFIDDQKVANAGCNGGYMPAAFAWAKNTAIATEASYPYRAVQGTCQSGFSPALRMGSVTGYHEVAAQEDALKAAVVMNPVSIAIAVSESWWNQGFMHYSSGVLNKGCGKQLDHGVLLVGYGTDPEGGDYWKVKNSWSSTWGENGYVRITRSNDYCGVLQSPSFPVVSGSVQV